MENEGQFDAWVTSALTNSETVSLMKVDIHKFLRPHGDDADVEKSGDDMGEKERTTPGQDDGGDTAIKDKDGNAKYSAKDVANFDSTKDGDDRKGIEKH